MTNSKWRPSLIIKGLLMGTADIIPGVSGGTLALITGIYRELILSIRSIGLHTILSPIYLLIPQKRAQGIVALKAVNWSFLLPLGFGLVTAILGLSKVIPHLLETQPTSMYSLFFGLIIASVIFPWRLVHTKGPELLLALAAGFLAFFVASTDQLAAGSLNPAYVFMCGAIAITAMILPGISGSYLLVILGEYKLILEAIHARDIATISVFMLGIIIGILTFSRVLNWLLQRYQSQTMAVLAGFMVGSLKKVWPGQYWQEGQTFNETWLPSIGFALLGIAIVVGLDIWSKKHRPEA